MDANQPLHYPIHVYDESPFHDDGRRITLCPGARHLNRPAFAVLISDISCRRCRELLDVLGLSPERRPAD